MESRIVKQLKKNNIKRDNDVHELYLAECDATEVPNLGRFKFLKKLYLNNNKVLHLNSSLQQNFVLTELYLQNNRLSEVVGALRHLACLRELLLHGNQLTDLQQLLHELENMQALNTLNLHDNPLAQETGYRDFVLYSIPSLELLDRQVVTHDERASVQRKFDGQQPVKDTIAFGRRLGNTEEFQPRQDLSGLVEKAGDSTARSDDASSSKDSIAAMEKQFILRHMSPEERFAKAIEERGKSRSIMQYSVLNWTEQIKSGGGKSNVKEPTIFTTKFR